MGGVLFEGVKQVNGAMTRGEFVTTGWLRGDGGSVSLQVVRTSSRTDRES
jgi:hypothetical protein